MYRFIYKNISFPIIRLTDSEWAHHTATWKLELLENMGVGRALLNSVRGDIECSPVYTMGLEFPNCLGIAAGFDKEVRVAAALARLGFGHVEVGTLTPKPQSGNPKPRIFRLPRYKAVINRMGFPNPGVEEVLPRLKKLNEEEREFILGVSIGKQKETPLESAVDDYRFLMKKVYLYSDYLAVNISSPNTPGLRELQGGSYLKNLCLSLVEERDRLSGSLKADRRPLLVKIAPDLKKTELDEISDIILSSGIDGVIATNTTLSRKGIQGKYAKEQGGLSGIPVRKKSTAVVKRLRKNLGKDFPIVGVGGISDASSAREKLDAGANLLQVYTSLIYEGPTLARDILTDLKT